ncbi:MAG: DUF1643 domain-containing protein [Methylococcaceae bacterium]|nr:DUF1643 domain-containing protein [Methylococcaceae bacterium]
MNNTFDIMGHFYELPGLKCRKYLDIKRQGANLCLPDIMVVMMNPGSSYPLDGIENNHVASKAHPDPTQNQIMAVMNNTGFHFARVLNLSDTRQPSSTEFYKFIRSKNANTIPHSIFHKSRIDEFSTLFRQSVPVIYGWGVDANLEELARRAMNQISEKNPIGLKKAGYEWAYYHPFPRGRTKQVEWVNTVTSLLS